MSTPQLTDFFHDLQPQISGALRTDDYSRMLYSTDASIYEVMPYGVLIPRTVEDVQAAVSLAAQRGIPILGRTGGSSLAGQAVNEALIIDFSRHLDQIVEINPEERWVRVQPGVVLDHLNAALKPHGLQFGPDPASSNRAAMGGIVSNNSTGAHSIVVGMTADHVLETAVLLNDGSSAHFGPVETESLPLKLAQNGRLGEIYRQLGTLTSDPANRRTVREATPRHWRRCGGYNLDRLMPGSGVSYHHPPDPRFNIAKLLCGAEGTLGILTEIKLNLVPLPAQTAVAIVQFNTLREALTAVPLILETNPSAVEMLDHLGLSMCREVPEYARLLQTFLDGNPYTILIVEYSGPSEADLAARIEHLRHHLRAQGVNQTGVLPVMEPTRQKNVWTVRKVGLGLLMSVRGDYKPLPFIEDAAVPVEHLADYVDRLEEFCHELGTEMAYYAHASAGCLHIRPLINAKQASEIAKLPQITRYAVELLHGFGGALSSEHGDGRSRSGFNQAFFGPELYGLYQQVKHIFDPENLFNPGNIVDGPDMTEKLRYGDSYQVIPLTTHLDFRADQGFDQAVEMCNGAGVCRKLNTGAMCPSFMATREEEHSTRGRANALRAAMNGRLPNLDFSSERLYETMDLCISCKACKAECPSSVDMAKLKTEFLAQYHQHHGVPLRDRVFAHIGTLSRLGAGPLAPISNWSLQNGLIRAGMARLLGISRERTLPPFAKRPFTHWFHQRPTPPPGQPLLLFHDTFATYNYPHIAQAAVELLEAAGYQITLSGVTDTGRPAFSKGLIKLARRKGTAVLDALAPFAEQGTPILFLEPSELSMVIDDYAVLLPDDARVPLVAQHALSFESFVAQQATAGTLNLRFTEKSRHILLHGHCHQKALIGTQPAHTVLTLPPNYTVEELDTSCCGMAGSFGYEAEHYAVSRTMAERRLWPAVREAAGETAVVAAGVSCRQQIEHGTQRRALHPAELLREAMGG